MSIDFAHYKGREPAFVKHTFLDKYLPRLIGKVGKSYPEFVYVDGFAGPWKSRAGQAFEDTSFGIALRHMTALAIDFGRRGRSVRMRAFLVEKDAAAHSELERLQERFPRVEIKPFRGLVEDHVLSISQTISVSAFAFMLFDPKGFPDPSRLRPLLSRRNSEALVNFMFDFANRFAGTDLIPALGSWLEITGVADWRTRLAGLPQSDREAALDDLAREALRKLGAYRFAPAITVDRAAQDRPLYKLIYLSRHDEGIAVFRESERKALEAQATARSQAKTALRDSRSAMDDLFAQGEDAIANDRSSRRMREGKQLGENILRNALITAGADGVAWEDLWPTVLSEAVTTRSDLGRHVNALRKSGALSAPAWPSERTEIPPRRQRLILNGS